MSMKLNKVEPENKLEEGEVENFLDDLDSDRPKLFQNKKANKALIIAGVVIVLIIVLATVFVLIPVPVAN